MKTGNSSRELLVAGLWALLLGTGAGCTLNLKDTLAPSAQLHLETQHELKRWGGEKVGRVPTPPEVKETGTDRSGVGFQVRGRFSSTFTWMNPEGSLDSDYVLFGDPHRCSEPVRASGWGYRGRLCLMPGLSLARDCLFLSPFFVGVEGSYVGLDIRGLGDTPVASRLDLGRVGIPIGFHIEGTLASMVTPYFTFAYVPTLYNGGTALVGHDFTFELGARFWPGTVAPVLGTHLWVEAGWLWTNSTGTCDPFGFLQTDLEIGGPVVGIGWRF